MGVVHGTPAEAASAALGPGGWLGPVASLDLYPIHVTDTAYVAMYTGYDGKNTERPVPVMGATDGLYLRQAGIPTYGVQGLFYDRDDIRFHGRDERVKVQSFYEAQTFLYELVKRLSVGK